MQVERLILVFLDELDRRRCRPFRVMSFERRLHIAPVNVPSPSEAAVFDELPVDLFVAEFELVAPISVFGVLRDIVNAMLLVVGLIMFWAYVVFAYKAGRIAVLGKDCANVHIVVFQSDVECG